jgi:hypothetical protein
MYFCSKENKIIMRKSFIAIIILILCVAGIDIILPRNDRPFADQLKEAVNTCELTTYTDDDFGFAAEYPQFFTQEDQTDDEYVGHARFSYWDHWMRTPSAVIATILNMCATAICGLSMPCIIPMNTGLALPVSSASSTDGQCGTIPVR